MRQISECKARAFVQAPCVPVLTLPRVRIIIAFVVGFQSDWFGNSLYDLIHADDVEKLREQLSTTESQNTGRILDLKSQYRSPRAVTDQTLVLRSFPVTSTGVLGVTVVYLVLLRIEGQYLD